MRQRLLVCLLLTVPSLAQAQPASTPSAPAQTQPASAPISPAQTQPASTQLTASAPAQAAGTQLTAPAPTQAQPASTQLKLDPRRITALRIGISADAGYQYTHYDDGFWSGDYGSYSGPTVAADLFLLWRKPINSWGHGLRLGLSYGQGQGTYSDGEGFNPAGGSDERDDYALSTWYLRSSALYVFASDYFWVGSGLAYKYQREEIAWLGSDYHNNLELTLASGLELPLGHYLSLTAKGELNTNILFSNSVSCSAGLKARF